MSQFETSEEFHSKREEPRIRHGISHNIDMSFKSIKEVLDSKLKTLKNDFGNDTMLRLNEIADRISKAPIMRKPLASPEYSYVDTAGLRSLKPTSGPIPVTSFYFSLFALWFLFLSRRVWSERRKTRVYYGNGTSELSYAIGSQQIMDAAIKGAQSSNLEDTSDNKERAWRIKNLRKLVTSVEARETLLSNTLVSTISLLTLEISEFSLGLLHFVGFTSLLSGLILCERGIFHPSAKVQSMMLTVQWTILALSSFSLLVRVMNLY